jgi:hypothetical protein
MKPKVGSLKIKIRGSMATSEEQHLWKEEVHMTKKYMMQYSRSLAIKNVNLNYSEIPFQLRQKGTIKKTTKYKCRWWWEERQRHIHCSWERKLVQPWWKPIHIMEILQETKIELPYNPVILLLGVYPEECNSA